MKHDKKESKDANRDRPTGTPGSHLAGTGIGAAGGAAAGVGAGMAAGAAAGTATGGPIGAAVGGAVGAAAGAVAGHAIAEKVDPTAEDAYWREQHTREPYYTKDYPWNDYRGAYRTGYEGYAQYGRSDRSYHEIESDLQREYERNRGQSRLGWEQARPAVRAAWDRFDRHLEKYIDYEVVDKNDSKIGTLKCIWSDQAGEPAYVGVQTGWLFGKTHVVPAQSVQASERSRKLRLPYDEQMVKDAPAYDAEAEMGPEKEREVDHYYGIGSRRGHAAQATPPARASQERTTEHAEIPLAEEELKVGTRQVEAGGVRLRKIVRTEIVNQPVELKREEIVVERVPAEHAEAARQEAFEQEEIYIPLRREEAVVQKETRVREVVRATKSKLSDQQQVSETVRKEDVEIEKTGEAREANPRRGGKRSPAEEMAEREDLPRSQRRRE